MSARSFRLENRADYNTLTVQYSILAGIRNEKFKTDVADGATALEAWYNAGARHNSIIELGTDAMLADPFNYAARDFQPEATSPVLNASYWFSGTGIGNLKVDAETLYCYPNPFYGVTHIDVTISAQTQLVKELYNDVAYPGVLTLEFDATDLPEGIYIGKVVSGNQSFVVKMVSR